MFDGYIKLYRTSLDSDVFQNQVAWKIWTWCLLKATHQEFVAIIGRQTIELKPGQFIFGGRKASEELGFAISTIWYWLTFFEKEGQAELKKTNKFTVITILNWHKYQTAELKKNSKRTQKEPYKNVKNVKNDKEEEKREGRFAPPSIEEVSNYCKERKNGISAEGFVNYYESKGWVVGKTKMKNWRAAVRTWENRDKKIEPAEVYFNVVGNLKFKTIEEQAQAEKDGKIRWDGKERRWFETA